MSTTEVLNAKLLEFNEWINNLSQLDNNMIQQYQNEIKLKGRNFVKFHAEVKVLNDQQLITKFTQLMQQFKRLRAISNGQTPPSPPTSTEDDKKSQSPEPKDNTNKTESSSTKSCIMGKDCNSNDPKHYYDYIHFDHPKSDDMIIKYEKYLKKQQCKQIYEQHQNTKKNNKNTNVSSEFSQFLTDEELAQQLQAMQSMEIDNTSNNCNSRPKRRQKSQVIYKEDDDEDKESSAEEDDDSDEDFDESEARRTYRRKIKNRKKEDEKRKLEEETMDADELEKLRSERLNKLLGKTEAYMKTLTRRVRKNFKENNSNNNNNGGQLSTNDVRSFLTGDSGKDEAIEQTKSLIGGTLKDYQQIGLKWMVTLNQMRLNGILADEMGLGKTVQVLGLLAFILDNNNVRGKHLIVAPLSTLSSWRDHFADWLPALNVYLHRGPASERKEKLIEISKEDSNIDVVISTYQMVIRDAETMSNIKWNYLIVDEAHTLKNSKGRLFESLNAFSTKHRLLLTGTPLQNNLNELWSLLNFILPSIFDSAQSFESWFCSPFQHLHQKKNKKDKDESMDLTMTDNERLLVMDRLHRAIDPFLLRRMKKDVLPEMVKKEEIVIKIPISGMQSTIYKQLQKYGALMYKNETKRHGFNNIMMQLRKVANHPYLFAPEQYDITDDIYRSSGKFTLLRHLIPKMKRFNHRMLVFCQFVQTMDILSEFLDFINESYLRIDGGTDSDDRIDYLAEFNKGNCDADKQNKYSVFLLSTRACGLGLNLYSADTVILFDSDWNPQQDLQAMARCHRIGQTKEVRVFRLISDNTIEESIYDRAQNKLDLERKAIECGKFDFSISGKERKEFLQEILKQRTDVNNKYASNIERKKLNQLLSRTENEWKVFEKMDKNNKNQFLELLTDETLPEWLDEITTDKDAAEVLPAKRCRKQIKYNENEYWKNIIENCKSSDKENEDEDNEDNDVNNKKNNGNKNKNKNKNKKGKNNRKRKRNEMSKDDNNNDMKTDEKKKNERKKRKLNA